MAAETIRLMYILLRGIRLSLNSLHLLIRLALLLRAYLDRRPAPLIRPRATRRSHCHLRLSRAFSLRLRNFRHRRFGEQQHAGDRNCVFQCDTNHLCRIDDASLDQVDIFLAGGIETKISLAAQHARNDYTARYSFRSSSSWSTVPVM